MTWSEVDIPVLEVGQLYQTKLSQHLQTASYPYVGSVIGSRKLVMVVAVDEAGINKEFAKILWKGNLWYYPKRLLRKINPK